MNGRERIEAAFSPEGTPEFAAVIPYEGIYIRDHWSQLTQGPWWWAVSPNLEQQLAWRREVIPAIGQDWISLPEFPSRATYQETRIETREDGVFLVSCRTGSETRLPEPVIGGWESFDRREYGRSDCLEDTVDEIDRLIPLQPPFPSGQFWQEGRDDLARALMMEYGNTIYPLGDAVSPLWKCYTLWGFQGMMERVATRPDLVKYACSRFLHNELISVHKAAALGAAGIWLEECLTDMVHPRDFLHLNLPYLRALVEEIHSLGMHSIYYFCGNPAGKLSLLLESGADAISLEESKKGFKIDIDEVAEFVEGRCVLLGNLDAIHLLPHASEPDLKAELTRQAAAGRKNNGRFIHCLGSPVTPGTSPERVKRYCELAREIENTHLK